MKVVIITQARMTSTRLPGKVLKLVQGKSLLEHHIERLRRVPSARDVVVATTVNGSDDCIVALCKQLRVSYCRGSEEDVLSRYYEAAKKFKADVIVRVTSDCPVIDPLVVEKVICWYLDRYPNLDYVSNGMKRTYPRGMDTEVFSFKILQEVYREATDTSDREHVMPFVQRQPDRFNIGNVTFHENQSRHRWTVDTEDDLKLITKIIDALYPIKKDFDLKGMLALLEENPEWEKINSHVEQKK